MHLNRAPMAKRYYTTDCRLVSLALIPSKIMGKTELDIYVTVEDWCTYNVKCNYKDH